MVDGRVGLEAGGKVSGSEAMSAFSDTGGGRGALEKMTMVGKESRI